MSQSWHFWTVIMLSLHQYPHICSSSSSPSFTANLFEKWSQEHGKSYSSEQEKQYRIKVFEENYDYINQHNSKANSSYTLSLNAFADLTRHEFKAKYLLGQPRLSSTQPLRFGICGSDRAFQFYSQGIFTGPCCNTLDHRVLIAGYDSRNGTAYWKVKNSWGTNWGINGYMQLAIRWNGTSCGINNKEIIMNYASNSKSDCYPFTCHHGQTCCCYKRVALHCIDFGCCATSYPICCKTDRACCPEGFPICDRETHVCIPKHGNATTILAKQSKIRGLSAMLGN